MLTATKARETADKVRYDTSSSILTILDKHIRQACKQGRDSLGYLTPHDTTKETIDIIKRVLTDFGYEVNIIKEEIGYNILIYW